MYIIVTEFKKREGEPRSLPLLSYKANYSLAVIRKRQLDNYTFVERSTIFEMSGVDFREIPA